MMNSNLLMQPGETMGPMKALYSSCGITDGHMSGVLAT